MQKLGLSIAVIFIALSFGYSVGFYQGRADYNSVLAKWNDFVGRTRSKVMLGTGNWTCGKMVVSCNEKGYLNMVGSVNTNESLTN